jgi:hypothetical protein
LLACALLFAGCGRGLAGAGYVTPFGTISGTLAISPGATIGNPQIALLWLSYGTDGAGQVSQALSVGVDSLARFDANVDTLPPPSTIYEVPDGSMGFAQGALVAYDDVDGDGRLDIGTPDAPSRDRVLGRSYDTRVFFLGHGQPLPVSTGFGPAQRGLSLVHFQQRDPQPGACASISGGQITEVGCMFDLVNPAPLALPGDVTVEVRDDPALQGYACDRFWGSEEWPDFFSAWNKWSPLASQLCNGPGCDCTGTGCALDLPPPGVSVTCNSDGTAYVYKTCVADPSLCGTRFCHYGHGERAPGTIPSGWPCP